MKIVFKGGALDGKPGEVIHPPEVKDAPSFLTSPTTEHPCCRSEVYILKGSGPNGVLIYEFVSVQ